MTAMRTPVYCLLGFVVVIAGIPGLLFPPSPPSAQDLPTSLVGARETSGVLVDHGVLKAARAFVTSLCAEQKAKACRPFDPAREEWGFLPGPRAGIALADLSWEGRQAAHQLLSSVLSEQGYLKTTAIMELENVLRLVESGPGRDVSHRNPEAYFVAVFGEVSETAPFSFRLEGHHLSWNITFDQGRVVAAQPSFLGANPAEVRSGTSRGLRVLRAEEDEARQFMAALTEEQRAQAIFSAEAPSDIFLVPGRKEALPRVGLSSRRLTDDQRQRIWKLVEVYAHNLRGDLADAELATIRPQELSFGWAGSLERGQGHYYRIQGESFAIEYDNTQSGANHIHTVWHDLMDNFGNHSLRRHHKEAHGGK